jgi:hypothetical protein
VALREIRLIVVHHSASPTTTTAKQIARWHSAPKPIGRGWRLGTGYHRVIEGDGGILDGRKIQWRGAHAKGANTGSVGVCVVGDNTKASQRWTSRQEDALAVLLTHLCRVYPMARVAGHRDLPGQQTVCPGLSIRAWAKAHGLRLPLF